MSDDLSAGRLERIERMLERVEAKIDTKVDALDTRLRVIEVHGTPHMADVMSRISDIRRQSEEQIGKLSKGQQVITSNLNRWAGGLGALLLVVELSLRFWK